MSVQIHETEFHTRAGNKADARARCTCGWFAFGTLAEVQGLAAVHDLWLAEPAPQPAEAPAHA